MSEVRDETELAEFLSTNLYAVRSRRSPNERHVVTVYDGRATMCYGVADDGPICPGFSRRCRHARIAEGQWYRDAEERVRAKLAREIAYKEQLRKSLEAVEVPDFEPERYTDPDEALLMAKQVALIRADPERYDGRLAQTLERLQALERPEWRRQQREQVLKRLEKMPWT
jgi:hypothetical protein